MSALLAASSLAGCPAKAAPTDANITGHVVDSETGEHMPYYTIRLLGTSIGTLTDASGHYTLRNLNPGNYTIEALCTGYKTWWPTRYAAPKTRTLSVPRFRRRTYWALSITIRMSSTQTGRGDPPTTSAGRRRRRFEK